jgi:hypothetical protein
MGNPIGTIQAGEVIANIRTRFGDLTEEKYPSKLMLRDMNNAIAELQAESNLDDDDYKIEWTVFALTDKVDLSVFPDYKLLKSIELITYNGILADNISNEQISAQLSYGNSSLNRDSVVWYRRGYNLFFHKGSGVDSYGERIIYLNRLPYRCIELSDLLDLKDDKISLLEDKILVKVGLKTPEKVQNMKKSDQEDKMKTKEK